MMALKSYSHDESFPEYDKMVPDDLEGRIRQLESDLRHARSWASHYRVVMKEGGALVPMPWEASDGWEVFTVASYGRDRFNVFNSFQNIGLDAFPLYEKDGYGVSVLTEEESNG